jgi:Sulfatase/Tetratricopeptide repeat
VSGSKVVPLLLFGLLLACARREEHPPIVLISVDTLRADRVGALTPNINLLGRDAIRCSNAWSHVPLTLPSHLSIFTGLLPPEHGVRDNAGYRFDSAAHPTLAMLLRNAGYHTAGAVSAYVLRSASGAAAGFDEYDDAIGMVSGAPAGSLQRRGEATEAIAESMIAKSGDKPLFVFLHLYEPHTPYEPTYDADVAHADRIVGKFLQFLKQRRLYDRALIVLLSDHGEGLMDHGEQEHGVFLYREALQVPLILKLPHAERRGTTIDAPVQLVDVMATVLAIANVPSKSSILDAAHPKSIYAESLYPRIHLGWSDLRALVSGERHYIAAPHPELYDLAHDAREQHNVVGTDRRNAAALRDELAQFGAKFSAPDTIDAEEAKRLAALGYVGAGAETSGPLPDPKERIGDLAKLKAIAALRDPRAQIAAIEPLLAANPQWSDLRDQLGEAYEAVGEPAKAAAAYEAGIRATPRLAPQFARSAAEALLLAGDLEGADAHARVAAAGGAPGAHLLLGEIALVRHDLDAASREASAAESDAADRAPALFLEARVDAARSDYPDALQLLDREEQVRRATGASQPRRFHDVAADALAHLGRFTDAQREFDAALAADPHDLDAWSGLALLALATGRKGDALATIERMQQANPSPRAAALATEWRRRVAQ